MMALPWVTFVTASIVHATTINYLRSFVVTRMSPERTLDEDSSDGASDHLIAEESIEEELLDEEDSEIVRSLSASGGAAGVETIVGDHVTIETSSPIPSPGAETTISTGTGPAVGGAGMLVMTDRNGTATTTTTGKLVLLHQGRAGEDYITTTGETINGGNIVLLATEQMDMAEHDIINNNVIISTTNSGTGGTTRTVALPAHHQPHLVPGGGTTNGPPTTNGDEDLTSLSWLQDKNLIKGNGSWEENLGKFRTIAFS
uniref:Uncharacterized protein n=1 Tax=Anopheles maculatus TaxID=74869 RepID=A0A182TBY2_9DIPT